MKTFDEYYNIALEKHNKWLTSQKEEWWRGKNDEWLDIKGEYDSSINFLSNDERNDTSLFHNHTNVKNSEWSLLFSMLGQALVDWCVENTDWKDLWAIGICIKKDTNGHLSYSHYVEKWDFDKKIRVDITNKYELNNYEDCKYFLCDIVYQFIKKHEINIPNDWNHFSFGLDSLMDSCKWGEWVSSSDGYINLGKYIKAPDKYEVFVECM